MAEETYRLRSGEAAVIFNEGFTEVRVAIEKRDLTEVELVAIGLSQLLQKPEWRRGLALKTKEYLTNEQIKERLHRGSNLPY
jgi:hypothetical protein